MNEVLQVLVISGAAQFVALIAMILAMRGLRRDVAALCGPSDRPARELRPCTGAVPGPGTQTAAVAFLEDEKTPHEQGEGEEAEPACPIRFVVDAMLLVQLYQYLRHSRVEGFTYIAGYQTEAGQYLLAHLVPVALAKQSVTGAQADANSSIEALGSLAEFGFSMTAHAHTHPGHGPGSITPSGTDRRFVNGLAAGHYTALGLIFSQDGYVRAYNNGEDSFTLEIRGKNVTEVSENVWRIDPSLADRPVPIGVPAVPGRSQPAARCTVRL